VSRLSARTATLPALGDRQELIAQAAAAGERQGSAGNRLGSFLERYFHHVATSDLEEREPVDLAGLALSHRQLAADRPAGTSSLRVFTPTVDQHGWTTGHTVVEIVTDDMPFLVDSVNAELSRQDRPIHLVIHPQLVVRRDAAGALLEVLERLAGDAGADQWPDDAVVESWIHVEIERETDQSDIDAIAAGLRRVLEDVRVAVLDWPHMRGRAAALADELRDAAPAGVPEDDVTEAVHLLTWLADGNFTFLGYREYDLVQTDGEDTLVARDESGLGILRAGPRTTSRSFGRLSAQARAKAHERTPLVITKANSRSTVHRRSYLDYIGVRMFDDAGNVTGERRFLGLFASSAYTESVRRIPVVERKVRAVLERSGFSPESHSGKDLLRILETYPRDELFQISVDDLFAITIAVSQLQERRRTRLFMRTDDYGRYVSCLVYLPRERYTTAVRHEMERILMEAFDGTSIDFSTMVSESVLARLYFVVRLPHGRSGLEIDPQDLEARLVQATRSWDEDLSDALRAELGEEEAGRLARIWGAGFPEAYKEDFPARIAVADLRRLDELERRSAASEDGDLFAMNLYEPVGAQVEERRFKLYRRTPLSLTTVLPYLANLGVEVVDERPYALTTSGGGEAYIYDFGLRRRALPGEATVATGHPELIRELFSNAFAAAWRGETESDGFDRLVLGGCLTWRQVSVLRAYGKYLRQSGTTFSQDYIELCLATHIEVAVLLAQLFEARFDPDRFTADDGPGLRAGHTRQEVCDALTAKLRSALDDVPSLDHDRILRAYLGLVLATVRTNYFRTDAAPCLVFKLDPRAVPDLPDPRPAHEIFVYSPRVEGVHLRFGSVARGGLRWSDRREDFRTEILGLVKAQMVKNAVIVPTGAKGGFVAKQLPDPGVDRDAWLAEGIASYRTFIRGLLDVTDNLQSTADGQVRVPPARVVRHDGDDSYLVVAADKGTAAFSDIANALAIEAGFWLGDAFASGGSTGYDHKAMGITARGAWESVKRHFRELDLDVQAEDFTVIGVGDMSGDVFGNGMLLSEHIRLVAAFDHRHIFLDPDPDAAVAFAERQRLFRLPRSSWADYDTSLISPGGGIYPRSAKSVPISQGVARRLGLASDTTSLTPAELLRAILTAPADLLWNGGIGTYVKASTETNADVGDKANDAIRVNGAELRVRVVGEGGNLGLTQLGRVEAALAGVRVNTDAIDNSAGVDCSDHEVNIKILLDRIVAAGDLTTKQRNELLAEMTEDVARLVLRDNYEQNVLLGNARRQSLGMLGVHQRLMRSLEARGALDRALEFLPDDSHLARRAESGGGLTSPEFSVLVAYVKNTLADELVETGLPDEPWLARVLRSYFPPQVVERYGDRLSAHPLRQRIITTRLVNDMVNRGGITFVHRARDETAASSEQVTRAYIVCREIFGLDTYVAAVEALDNQLTTDTQGVLYLTFRRLLDRSVRWFLQARPNLIDIGAEIDRFGPVVAELAPKLPELCVGADRQTLVSSTDALMAEGVPAELAERTAGLLTQFMLLDITEIATLTQVPPEEVARIHLALSDRYAADALLDRITGLPRADRWQAMARGALRYDLYGALQALTMAVLTGTSPGSPAARIEEWEQRNAAAVQRAINTLSEVRRLEHADIASVSVALRTLRSVVRTASVPAPTRSGTRSPAAPIPAGPPVERTDLPAEAAETPSRASAD
jgi:glutamate dehydrogenase